jgi:hypothetical protein
LPTCAPTCLTLQNRNLYFGPQRTHWPPPWHLHCFSAIGRGPLPKWIHEVFMNILRGHPFLTEVLKWWLWFQFSPFGLNDRPLYWSKCVLCYLICEKLHIIRSVIFNKISLSTYCA